MNRTSARSAEGSGLAGSPEMVGLAGAYWIFMGLALALLGEQNFSRILGIGGGLMIVYSVVDAVLEKRGVNLS